MAQIVRMPYLRCHGRWAYARPTFSNLPEEAEATTESQESKNGGGRAAMTVPEMVTWSAMRWTLTCLYSQFRAARGRLVVGSGCAGPASSGGSGSRSPAVTL